MKKHRILLLLLALLAAVPIGARAQADETFLVGEDGTESLYVVPIVANYIDPGCCGISEVIYPSDLLADIAGSTITSLKFFQHPDDEEGDHNYFGVSFKVFMQEVDEDHYPSSNASMYTTTDRTLVYEGGISIVNGEISIELDDPFTYEGGNLAIVVTNTTNATGDYNYKRTYFIAFTTTDYQNGYNTASSGGGGQFDDYCGSISTLKANLPTCEFGYRSGSGTVCKKPNGLQVSNITSTSADLSWTPRGDESQWVVYLNGQYVATVSQTNYSFSGLDANTLQSVAVRALCGQGDTSSRSVTTFRTECGDITLPYYQHFDVPSDISSATGMPYCWLVPQTYVNSGYYSNTTYPNITTTYGADGTSSSVYFYASSSSDHNLIVSPIIPADISTVHVSYYTYVSSGSLVVGFITDPNDISTFFPVDTITNAMASSWTDFDIYGSTLGYNESNARLAFYVTGYAYGYIDGVAIDQSVNCMRPAARPFTQVTYNSAVAHWTFGEDNATFELRYSTTNDVDNATPITDITDNQVQIPDLEYSTTYYAWVRTQCGTDNSSWRSLGTFTTGLACYSVTNLTLQSITSTSALISWQYNGLGRSIEETGVNIKVYSDNDLVREMNVPVADGNSAFITGLSTGSAYRIEVTTLCDPETANPASINISTPSCAEVSHYDGSSSTSYSYYYPVYGYGSSYRSMSQMIYPASSLTTLPSVQGIAFRANNPSYDFDVTVDIYMASTDKTEFASAADYVPETAFTLVASDKHLLVNTTSEWVPVQFDTPFTPDASMPNVIVMVHTKQVTTTGYSYATLYWTNHYGSGTGSQVLYAYSSSSSTITELLSGYGVATTSYRPHVRFLGDCNQTCFEPNLLIEGATNNSVDLRWAKGNDETQYAVQYYTDDATDWVEYGNGVSNDTTLQVTDLASATRYYFRVGTVCGVDTLWSNTTSIYTECDEMVLPQTYTFDNDPENPLCWQTTSRPYVSSGGRNNTRGLYIYPYTDDEYVISQQVPIDPNKIEITWWARYTNNYTYEVGVMSDRDDVSTFRTIFRSNGNNSNWTEYTVYTDTITYTEPVYVAFRCTGSNYNFWYLDDITISEATCFRPTAVVATSIASDNATVAWQGQDGASYEIALTNVATAPSADNDTIEIIDVAETSYTFNDLQPTTTYYAWVRTVCDEGVTSWSSVYNFRTSCVEIVAPYAESFENMSDDLSECWSTYTAAWSTTPTFSNDEYTWSVATQLNSSLPADGKFLAGEFYDASPAWAISPSIVVGDNMMLSFDMSGAYYSWNYYSGSYSAPQWANSAYAIVAISTDGGATYTKLYKYGNSTDSDTTMAVITDTPQKVILPLTEYAGDTVRVAFVLYSTNNSYYTSDIWCIDNVEIQSVECMRPVNVAVDARADYATISWVDLSSDNNDGYQLVVNTVDDVTGNSAIVVNITDTFYTVTGLLPSTRYYYFVRSMCDENSAWASGNFKTECAEIHLPYNEDFEAGVVNSQPDCWTLVEGYANTAYGGNVVYPCLSTISNNKALQFYGYDYYSYTSGKISIATPRIPAPLNQLEIAFSANTYGTYYEPLTVYVGTNLSDTNTWIMLGQVSNNGWTEYEYTTTDLDVTDTGYVIFSGDKDYSDYTYAYIDSVYIGIASSCVRPASVQVTDVTPYTADIEWAAVEGAAAYRVKYSQTNDILNADSLADVSTNSTTISGLQNGQKYYVWVQTVCGDEVSGARATSFTTEISCYPLVDLRLIGTSATAATFMWDIDARGNEAQSVEVTLHDMTDTDAVDIVTTASGLTYHQATNLTQGHTYRAIFRTVCDVDSAAALSIDFAAMNRVSDGCLTIEDATGATTTSDDDYGPMNDEEFTYAQMLYVDDNLDQLDTITGIAFNVTGALSSDYIRTIDVYIGNTSQTSNDAISRNQMTCVATNYGYDVSETGWSAINFSTPFVHEQGKNIVVAVKGHNNIWGHFNLKFSTHGVTEGGSRFARDMSDEVDETSSTDTEDGTRVADITFYGNCNEEVCNTPVFAISNVDSTSIEIVYTSDASSTVVLYRTQGSTDWQELNASGSPMTISGLQPGTRYEVCVKAVCSDEMAVTSTVVRFTTDCAPVHIPFVFSMADMLAVQPAPGFSPCWTWDNAYRSQGAGVGYVYTYSNGYFALPEIAEPLNTTQLRTKVSVTSSGGSSFFVGVKEADGTVTRVEEVEVLRVSSNYADYDEYVVSLEGYTGTGTNICVGTTGNNYVYFLDFTVEQAASCHYVSNVQATNVGEHTATISWTAGGGENQWLVYANGQLHGTATSTTYQMTGLSSATRYTVEVRSLCSATDTAVARSVVFRTECGNITSFPWVEDFEAYAANAPADCFTTIEGTEPQVYEYSYTAHSGSKYLSLSSLNGSMTIVTPIIEAPANTITGSLYVYATGGYSDNSDVTVEIGVMTNPSDISTFTVIASQDFDNYSMEEMTFSAANCGITSYAALAIRASSTYSYASFRCDDLTVNATPGVGPGPGPGPQPTECTAPTIVSATPTDNSIALVWSNTAASYEWAIVEGTNWTNPQAGTAVSANSTTISNLEPAHDYTVGVRAVCEGGERSLWATRTVHTTNVGIDDVLADSFSLYPNPASISVSVMMGKAGHVAIIDAAGRQMGSWNTDNGKLTINLDGYAAGAYYVRVTTADGTAVRKLIVR